MSLEPFTVDHYREYASRLVFEDGENHEPEDWQLAFVGDVFAGFTEAWLITPEANSKSTEFARLALYAADYCREPFIPVGAAASRQARIIFDQAEGFILRTPGMAERFKPFGGYKLIRSVRNGGRGIEIYAHDPKTGDGVIPYPFAMLDELHRHPDLKLYNLWLGKCRKRGAQLLAASTAGEPNSPFENLRNQVRNRATDRHRDGPFLRATGGGLVLHEYMVQRDEDCSDMAKVAEANPFSLVTEQALRNQYESPTRDDGDWKRLKCNRPARPAISAITDKEWDEAQVTAAEWDRVKTFDIGIDTAPKWDTTALVPLAKLEEYRLLGPCRVLTPPQDGSLLHPDEIKNALIEMAAGRQVGAIVMDITHFPDTVSWMEDEFGVPVVAWGQSNKFAVEDFNSVMDGLRNGTLKHTGDPMLRAHAMNAIARRLPGGDYRFDRPNDSRGSARLQDRRVIDALTAAGMVTSFSRRQVEERRSVYEDRDLMVV